MEENILTPEEITKYHTAAVICKKVYNELKELIKQGERDIRVLSDLGNCKIELELNKIYKKENKYIGFPVSISLNNCVGNYVYDSEKDEFNIIKDDDIIKIELGVNIGGCISILGETFTISNVEWVEKANNFLIKLQKKILKLVENGYTGDDLRMYIESECTKVDMFPVENTISYQSERDFLKTSDSKYFILNNVKVFDQDENLISPEFINYEFETNDIYNINLSIIPTCDNKIVIKNHEKSHLYTLNDYTYQLKMKSSRAFYNTIKSKHYFNPFEIEKYLQDKTFKMGKLECIKNYILEPLPISFVKEKTNDGKLIDSLPVIIKKFTILVKETSPAKLVGS